MAKLRQKPLSFEHHFDRLLETSENLDTLSESIALLLNPMSRKRKRLAERNQRKIVLPDAKKWFHFHEQVIAPTRTLGKDLSDNDATSEIINTGLPALMSRLSKLSGHIDTLTFFSVGLATPLRQFLDKQPDHLFKGVPIATPNTLSKILSVGYAHPLYGEFLSVSSLQDLEEADIARLYEILVQHVDNNCLLRGLEGNDKQNTALLMLVFEFFRDFEKLFFPTRDTTLEEIRHHFENGSLKYLADFQFNKTQIKLATCLACRLVCFEMKTQVNQPEIVDLEANFISNQPKIVPHISEAVSLPNVSYSQASESLTPKQPSSDQLRRPRKRIPLPAAISEPSVHIDLSSPIVAENNMCPTSSPVRRSERLRKQRKLEMVMQSPVSFRTETVKAESAEPPAISKPAGPPPPPPPPPPVFKQPVNVIEALKQKKREQSGQNASSSSQAPRPQVDAMEELKKRLAGGGLGLRKRPPVSKDNPTPQAGAELFNTIKQKTANKTPAVKTSTLNDELEGPLAKRRKRIADTPTKGPKK